MASNASRTDGGSSRLIEADIAGRHGAFLFRRLHWSPKDVMGLVAVAFATTAIVINALFMQSGSHPAPIFKDAAVPAKPAGPIDRLPLAVARPRQAEPAPVNVAAPSPRSPGGISKGTTAGPPATRPAPAVNNVVTDRPAPSKRVIAVQRALAEYGYGQIKPSGIIDAETQAAIQKFERERKLPISGQASDRVVRELAAMTGRPLD